MILAGPTGTGAGARIRASEYAWMQHSGCRQAPDDGLVVYWRRVVGREGSTGACKYKLIPRPVVIGWHNNEAFQNGGSVSESAARCCRPPRKCHLAVLSHGGYRVERYSVRGWSSKPRLCTAVATRRNWVTPASVGHSVYFYVGLPVCSHVIRGRVFPNGTIVYLEHVWEPNELIWRFRVGGLGRHGMLTAVCQSQAVQSIYSAKP